MESKLLLWLLGFGVTEEQTKLIMGDRRIQNGLKLNDWSGLTIDLQSVLIAVGASEAFHALHSPVEQLFLMQVLRS